MREIKEHVPLAERSTFHVGGSARFATTVTTTEEMQEAIAWARSHGVPWRVLGGGSNVLVHENGFPGLIVWYAAKHIFFEEPNEENVCVRVGAGAITAVVAGQTVAHNLTGFEWAIGVPGTIGGAVYGNAGALVSEMKDSITQVCALIDEKICIVTSAECAFAYRHSMFKTRAMMGHPVVVLEATMQLARAPDGALPRKKMEDALRYRATTQPKGLASSGCIFKNYELTSDEEVARFVAHGVPQKFIDARRVGAGWLIEHAGLKTTRIGGAEVSSVHGNFVVNVGAATARDIAMLIEKIKARVGEVYGVRLTEEITLL